VADTIKIEKLKKEIARLEEQMEKDRFGGIFDTGWEKRYHKKLKKLYKELEQLEKEK